VSLRTTIRHPLKAPDRKITEAQTCPGCGCNADQWREGCDCLRQGCACAGAEQDDTSNWEREPGPDAALPDAARSPQPLPPPAEPYAPPKKRPDLHNLRRGRWHDTNPTTTNTTNTGSAGGAAMSSIEEVRAGLHAGNELANEGLGALQHAHAQLEQAQGAWMRATEGSGQADVSTANGLIAQAVASIEEVRQQVSAAISASEDVGNRL
jgi:hypothetical protein